MFSGRGTTLSVFGSPDHSRAARCEEEKEREKDKAKDDPQGPEEHSLVMNNRKILNGGKKRTQFGGPRERKARRACQKAMMASTRVVLALTSPTKVQGKDFHQSKGRGKDQKREGKQGTYPPSGFSASETPNGEGYGQAWESDDWSASHWTDDSWTPHAGWFCTRTNTAWMMATPKNLANNLTHVVLEFGCTQSIGSRAAIERFKKHAWYYGITTKFCRGNVSVVFANSETETCKEKLPYPFSNNSTMFYQGGCTSCFPFLR